MTKRTILFVDYQNAYRNALDLFHGGDRGRAGTNGQFRPRALGELICVRYNERRPQAEPLALSAVRVYRGAPASHADPRGFSASRRQTLAWQAAEVDVFQRPLAYDQATGRIRGEKEIDVWLAIDLVAMALDGAYDVAVLFSADRDFRPALRLIRARFASEPRVDVAAWGGQSDRRFLTVEGEAPLIHFINEHGYRQVADPTGYLPPAERLPRARRRRRRR